MLEHTGKVQRNVLLYCGYVRSGTCTPYKELPFYTVAMPCYFNVFIWSAMCFDTTLQLKEVLQVEH